jgi:hypothetical protein
MSTGRSAVAECASPQSDSWPTLRHNPISLVFSPSLWQSAGYLLGYLLLSGVLFAIALTSITAALGLSITIVAIPLLVGAAFVVRGCAEVERGRLRQMLAEPVRGYYRPPDGHGLWRQARGWWGESTIWRDLGYLVGLWPLLFTLDTFVLAVWATFFAGITVPLWYSRVPALCVGFCNNESGHGLMIGYYPNGVHGPGHHGVLVHTLPAAFLAAAAFAVLFLLFNYVLVATARLHAQVARALLRPPADPLAPARAVLAGPGPLGPLVSTVSSDQGPSDQGPSGQGRPDDRLLR